MLYNIKKLGIIGVIGLYSSCIQITPCKNSSSEIIAIDSNKTIVVKDTTKNSQYYDLDTTDIEYLTINGESDSTIIGEWCFTDTCSCNICQ